MWGYNLKLYSDSVPVRTLNLQINLGLSVFFSGMRKKAEGVSMKRLNVNGHGLKKLQSFPAVSLFKLRFKVCFLNAHY